MEGGKLARMRRHFDYVMVDYHGLQGTCLIDHVNYAFMSM